MEVPQTTLPTTTAFLEAPTTTGSTDDIQAILQGWYYGGQTSGRAITCPDPQTFSITSPYADCLNPEATAVAAACKDKILTYDDGQTQEW
ncbi:hypothetical protein N7450_000790 [Penicillium hetheringtonii]|uniref:Uncharacterized protein n=1 Tax=Penicillium hetheringtonii TaxID=911720 RepID=A0AAD6E2R5_9EURO|nr:hypothetical protein N7450_000790 [Penicillium hetheringtonii]